MNTNHTTRHTQTNANLNALKLLAIAAMIWDHAAAGWTTYVNPHIHDYILLRSPGRICMPIFSFLVAWNLLHNTRNPEKYAIRLALWAIICEPIYINYFQYPGNAFLPLALGAAITNQLNAMTEATNATGTPTDTPETRSRRQQDPQAAANAKGTPTAGLIMLTCATILIALLFQAPDIAAQTATIPAAYFAMKNRSTILAAAATSLLPFFNGFCWQYSAMYCTALALIALCFHPAIKMPHRKLPKWAAYAFYPGHLIVLTLLFHGA